MLCYCLNLFHFQMSMWTTAVFVSVLMLLSTAAQAQMCEEPFQATLTLITNVTYPVSSNFLDPELVYYKEILRFTEQEIDREREAAIRFFKDFYGLDFANVEPNEQGQRIVGNATFQPMMSIFNNTFVFNSWLVNGRGRTRCYRVGDGGFFANFTGTVMLHGEYGGEEGKLGFTYEGVYYGHNYLYDACQLQGIVFQVESLAPIRGVPTDGWFVTTFRVRNRMLGEGVSFGVSRVTGVDSSTLRFESRQVYTFL